MYDPGIAITAVNHSYGRDGLGARDGTSERGALTGYGECIPSKEARTTKDWRGPLRRPGTEVGNETILRSDANWEGEFSLLTPEFDGSLDGLVGRVCQIHHNLTYKLG